MGWQNKETISTRTVFTLVRSMYLMPLTKKWACQHGNWAKTIIPSILIIGDIMCTYQFRYQLWSSRTKKGGPKKKDQRIDTQNISLNHWLEPLLVILIVCTKWRMYSIIEKLNGERIKLSLYFFIKKNIRNIFFWRTIHECLPPEMECVCSYDSFW